MVISGPVVCGGVPAGRAWCSSNVGGVQQAFGASLNGFLLLTRRSVCQRSSGSLEGMGGARPFSLRLGGRWFRRIIRSTNGLGSSFAWTLFPS